MTLSVEDLINALLKDSIENVDRTIKQVSSLRSTILEVGLESSLLSLQQGNRMKSGSFPRLIMRS